MTGQALHDFDVELSSYVLDNINANAEDPAFAAFIEEALDSAVLDSLKVLDGDDEPAPLLLSDHELFELGLAFLAGPFQIDRLWLASPGLHRRSICCVAEIRASLTSTAAEEWARASRRFARRLEGNDVWLHEGIEAVRKWSRELRRLLRAMGAVALLPRPEGTFPTPTYPAPADAPAVSKAPESQLSVNIGRMQEVIAKLGPDAKPDELIRRAEIARKPGRDALRELQRRGEYQGFARVRPHRYRHGLPQNQ